MENMNWDQRYLNGDKPWDKGSATPVLAELLDTQPDYFKPNMRALVPGCGIGHDVAFLHQAGINAIGLDISPTAINSAKQTYPHLGETWLVDDLFKMSHQTSEYDLIWEHTCYCAIPPSKRQDYIDSLLILLKPRGLFAGVFFIDTGQPPEVGPPFSTSRDEVFDNFNSNMQLVWEGKTNLTYPGRENKEWIMIWRKS